MGTFFKNLMPERESFSPRQQQGTQERGSN